MLNTWPVACITIFCCTLLCHAAEPITFAEAPFAPVHIGTKISIIRSNSSELPESINREAYATIDRARYALVELQNDNGTWTTDSGEETILPALALFDGLDTSPFYSNELSIATIAAHEWLKDNANKPWSTQQIKEAAIVLNLLAIIRQTDLVPEGALDHLNNISTQSVRELDPIGKYFLILALAQYNSLSIECFDTIIREQSSVAEDDLLSISIIGISRLMRTSSQIPANDAKAYLRYISSKLQLGYHNPSPGANERLTPQLGFLCMIFASSFSNRQLALDTTLFPYDWRNHLANRIIALQIYCPNSGLPYWEEYINEEALSRNSYNSLEATTLAILTLTNLVN